MSSGLVRAAVNFAIILTASFGMFGLCYIIGMEERATAAGKITAGTIGAALLWMEIRRYGKKAKEKSLKKQF